MRDTTVVLVHGAWAGAWAWTFVQRELDAREVRHRAVNLPSREPGAGMLADDVRVVREAADDSGGPVVLCGHSYGGVVVTEAAAGLPADTNLVYVCAVMPEEGESMLGLMAEDPVPSRIAEALRMTGDGTATLDPAAARETVLHDLDDATAATVLGMFGSHRMGTLGEAVSAVGWRGRPSTYVLCADDRVFSAALQERMAQRATDVVRLPGGHAPMVTRPATLAGVLADVAAQRYAIA